jgi:hypothetical protein
MTGWSLTAAPSLLATYDFAGVETLADIGGGRGALLAAVLNAYPSIRGTLFDLPHVVSGAVDELRTGTLAERCDIIGGDAFASVPEGRDLYLMRAVIHDWDDDDAVAILQVCRQAVPATGRLLLVERILGEGDSPQRKATVFSDLNMLVAPGGRERTREEFEGMLDHAGFALHRVAPTTTGAFVIEAVPA